MNTERYNRQINLKGFGVEAQQKLQQAKVLVVGAGGLGVALLQYLAGMGVGTIGIVDGDTVSLSNLNRQVLYGDEDIGKSKVQVASKKLSGQNSEITIQPFYSYLRPGNALDIIPNFDLVADATDSFSARYLINDACVILDKPFVYGALHQFEGQISVFNYKGGPTYRCLYPNVPGTNEIPDCNTAGVLGAVPGIIGCSQALEVVKVLTGVGKPSSGFVQIYDFLNNEQRHIKLKLKPSNKQIQSLQHSYEVPPCTSAAQITAAQLYNKIVSKEKFFLVDVRELWEHEQSSLEGSVAIPLSRLSEKIADMLTNIPVIAFCQQGGRSLKAAELIKVVDPGIDMYYLQGGLEQWIKEMGNKFVT